MDLDDILDRGLCECVVWVGNNGTDALDDLEACSWQPQNSIEKGNDSEKEKDKQTTSANEINEQENKREETKSDELSSTKKKASKGQEVDVIDEAVATVNASVNESRAHTIENGEDEMKEFFNTLLSSFDENTTDEQLEVNLRKMMGSFFNVESLKEPIQTIAEKVYYLIFFFFPSILFSPFFFLKEKKKKKKAQKEHFFFLTKNIWNKLQNGSKNVNMDEVMDLLTKTFSYGCLPNEVMDGMMPEELKQFANHMQQLEKDLETEEQEQRNSNNNNNNKNNNNDNNQTSKKKDDSTRPDNVNSEDYIKFLEQMMNGENGNTQQSDTSKLSPEELKRMRELMQSDCLLM
ncbi:hypothetical protein RFI_19238 [Reticulomyxa filosa]|uniref:Uncharacterized protein n=1 Tax=Reticulomyxa filosa TaxID=46433 RepID=X6MX53_RETFI|nr:hypothetical protein RFI_19238 [Reticulomyxa filosa]|eukprot:ETO18057.1 hypothetical protein RFI_19238 [Reticulomyxa filosa]